MEERLPLHASTSTSLHTKSIPGCDSGFGAETGSLWTGRSSGGDSESPLELRESHWWPEPRARRY